MSWDGENDKVNMDVDWAPIPLDHIHFEEIVLEIPEVS